MNTNYAGFWMRFVAWIIDKIVLGILNWLILAPLLAMVGISSAGAFPDFSDPDFDPAALIAAITAMIGVAFFVQTVVNIFYHSIMEASKFQGSLGKMALGLIVTDSSGVKLDFVKALVRNLCKIITDFTFTIGYIIAGLTAKKQALHDMIAGTLVVKK